MSLSEGRGGGKGRPTHLEGHFVAHDLEREVVGDDGQETAVLSEARPGHEVRSARGLTSGAAFGGLRGEGDACQLA